MELSKKTQKQLKELWGKVGFIVNLSQMIEYTLANILAFDEILREFEKTDSMFICEFNEFAETANKWYKILNEKTLGFGIKHAKAINFFTDESIQILEKICEERNFVVHHLFREDLTLKYLERKPSYYFERLETLINNM